MKPGSKRAAREVHVLRVAGAGGAQRGSTLFVSPTARMRPPWVARASALGRAGSRVSSSPPR